MNNLTPQQQIDLAAEQLRLMLAPFARNQQELDSMIDWAKHNAKAYESDFFKLLYPKVINN